MLAVYTQVAGLSEGETGLMVYAVLLRYWEWTPEEDVRPLIFLMSD